jgi:hypothetical protein
MPNECPFFPGPNMLKCLPGRICIKTFKPARRNREKPFQNERVDIQNEKKTYEGKAQVQGTRHKKGQERRKRK